MKEKIKRGIAVILTIVLCISMNDWINDVKMTTAFATERNETIKEAIALTLEWEDTEFKKETMYQLKEERPVCNAVKLKVSYSSKQICEEGYDAGELILVVKGIGTVNRSRCIEALVGADKESDTIKKHDWTYTWNGANDTYTFTNNQAIKKNSVLSGYFELVWEVDARNAIHGYFQDNIQATLYLPDGNLVQSETLSFSNETKIDTFETYIEQKEMYSYEGLIDQIENPEDYVFIRYNLAAGTTKNSRGLKEGSYYYFNPDFEGIGTGAIVISPILTYTKTEGETGGIVKLPYDTSNIAKQLESQYLFVAYPKEQYGDKNVIACLEKYGAYYEGDEMGNMEMKQLAIDTVLVPISSDFEFTDLEGSIYDFWKDTYYDKYVSNSITQEKGGDINGAKMQSGTVETFYLEGNLNNPDGIAYTLEFIDDYIYILKNNGKYRPLEAGEYEFKQVVIPGTASMLNLNGIAIEENQYHVFVYAVMDGNHVESSQMHLVKESVLKREKQTIGLPENTTAVVIVVEDITESIQEISIGLQVEFHIKDTSELEEAERDYLSNGQVVNTSFIKVYDQNETWINDKWTADNYIDDTNLNLAQKDIALYGNYLDREKDNITFYEGEKNDYEAYTKIDANANSLNATFTMGAEFAFVEDTYPNQFSLYAILPQNVTLKSYEVPEDIWDIMTISGLNLSTKQWIDACTPEIIVNYKESHRTYIALHFNFKDQEIKQKGKMEAVLQVKIDGDSLKKNANLFVKSSVIIDDSIPEYTTGKVQDDGSWGDDKKLFEDIDGDGNIQKYLDYGYSYKSFLYADSSQFQLTKYVKTTYTDSWVQLPNKPLEEYSGNYQYKLSITNGNNKSSHMVVMDLLETGENAEWKGSLQSVDLSLCEEIGLKGTVYYSDVEKPKEFKSNQENQEWSKEKGDSVKAIAVDFEDSVLKEGEELSIIVHMKAPEDVSLKDKVTENGFFASLTMLDSTTGNVTVHDSLISNWVQVQLTPALRTVVIQKVDEEDQSILSGAEFQLISKETGEVMDTLQTNEKGYAIFHNIPSNNRYMIREVTAPYGYEIAEDMELILDTEEKAIYITIENKRKKGSIQIHKTNHLDKRIDVSGAEYTLYDENGTVVESVYTDETGNAIFEKLQWGVYVVKETSSPMGYQLNEKEYTVEITRENVSNTILVQTENRQDDVQIHLIKYEKTVSGIETKEPVSGVTFELLRICPNREERVGLYVTDENGAIDITDLAYGEYYFREYRIPLGYESTENVFFTVSPEQKEITLQVYNRRCPGSITLIKDDNLGNNVSNAQFTLYDETKSKALGTYVTDEYGMIQIENLEWGTYYLIEVSAPQGYQLDHEWKEVVINKENLQAIVSCTNETLKGAVVLTKTNEEETTFLSGATYNLYKNDGTIIKEKLVTDENGQIKVEDLEWGTYYFKEIVAPVGYGLSEEMVRFSVNVLNAGITQYINVTDHIDERRITLTKAIKADEINFANGNPTFLFKVEGTDIHGSTHVYYRMVSFDENYVKMNTDENGYVFQSATISSLIAGEYKASEEHHSRYDLQEITNEVNGVVQGEQVVFDLVEHSNASATFVNLKYENQGFSDNQTITNILKEKVKLTALKVSYGENQVKAKAKVNRELLDVMAIYDDGTTVTIEDGYMLSIEKFPDENGDYTVMVSYEENGITRTDDFTVTISEANSRIVHLIATLKEDVIIYTDEEITSNMFDVVAVYSSGVEEVLNSETLDYFVSPNVAPSIEGEFIVTICLNPEVFPDEDNVSTNVTVMAKELEAILSQTFKSEMPTTTKQVIFTDEIAPEDVEIIDVSQEGNGTVVAWNEGTIMYISSQKKGKRIMAPEQSKNLFYGKKKLEKIDLAMLDTSNVVNMQGMFSFCNALTDLNLGNYFDVSNVTNMRIMFSYCIKLESLTIENWNTSNVENMGGMFLNCYVLNLDCSSWNVDCVIYHDNFCKSADNVVEPVWKN